MSIIIKHLLKFTYSFSLIVAIWSCQSKLNVSNKHTPPKAFRIHTVAFYNLENLFDTIDDPNKLDEQSPIMGLPPKLRQNVYWKKNANMAKVISEIGKEKTHDSPAIVGVAEIENRNVLEDLIQDAQLKDKNYGIIHYDSPDLRGIDVALLYRKALFHPFHSAKHEVVIYDVMNPSQRRQTRDVLLVSGVLDRDTLHIMVNHWPSRYGGEKISRKNRERAAAVNRRLADSLFNLNSKAKIIIMGDMNDGPYNTSIKKVLNAKAAPNEMDWNDLYNPMENMLKKKGYGTIGYQDSWDIFDQIILSKNLVNKDYRSLQFYKAGIYNPNYLITQSGRWKGYPFRSYANDNFSGGYSDHFPVYVYLIKE